MFMGMKVGYILKKSGFVTWTPRTRSRLSRCVYIKNHYYYMKSDPSARWRQSDQCYIHKKIVNKARKGFHGEKGMTKSVMYFSIFSPFLQVCQHASPSWRNSRTLSWHLIPQGRPQTNLGSSWSACKWCEHLWSGCTMWGRLSMPH